MPTIHAPAPAPCPSSSPSTNPERESSTYIFHIHATHWTYERVDPALGRVIEPCGAILLIDIEDDISEITIEVVNSTDGPVSVYIGNNSHPSRDDADPMSQAGSESWLFPIPDSPLEPGQAWKLIATSFDPQRDDPTFYVKRTGTKG